MKSGSSWTLAGLSAGAISPGLYGPVALMSIATSMIAPGLLTRLFQRKARSGSKPESA